MEADFDLFSFCKQKERQRMSSAQEDRSSFYLAIKRETKENRGQGGQELLFVWQLTK